VRSPGRSGLAPGWLSGPGDGQICGEIARLAGTAFSIWPEDLVAQLMRCSALPRVLTNDTGPMTSPPPWDPGRRALGSTSPELTGPGLPGDTHHELLTSAAPSHPASAGRAPLISAHDRHPAEPVIEAVLQAFARMNRLDACLASRQGAIGDYQLARTPGTVMI